MTAAPATPADGSYVGFVTSSETRAPLTPRQYEVLALLTDGSTYRAAADRLGLAEGTVKNTVSDACRRLDVSGLIAAYHTLGWIHVPTEDA